MTALRELADQNRKPAFGDWIRGVYASESNPQRDGMYVRTIRRTGRMNPGTWYEITDGKGGFWQYLKESTVLLDAERDGGAVAWIEGAPDKTYASEWFIAQTTNRERVVLTALPEEYAYDFKTADETYIKRENIKRWMQFPDSQFIPCTHPARPDGVSDADVDVAQKVYQDAFSQSQKGALRAVLEHFAKGERHE